MRGLKNYYYRIIDRAVGLSATLNPLPFLKLLSH